MEATENWCQWYQGDEGERLCARHARYRTKESPLRHNWRRACSLHADKAGKLGMLVERTDG